MTKITIREASSGKVRYGNSVVLHESSRQRITFLPYFISRSDHIELAIKIQTFEKQHGPNSWSLTDKKSVNLGGNATAQLLDELNKHLAVSKEQSNGSFVVLRLGGQSTDVSGHDPQAIASALAKVLSQKEIAAHLQTRELSDELLGSLRAAIRLREMQNAVADLREKLSSEQSDEKIYQEWCQNHSWAFGNAHVVNDDIRTISPSDSVDLLLPTVITGYRDLVELKRPNMDVLRFDKSHRNHYWSSDVSQAIGQCHRYLDVLHEVAANGLRDHPEIVAYHPRAIIVIGRSNDWNNDQLKSLHGLNHRLKDVTVMTYDQLLAQGERLLSILSPTTDSPPDDFIDFEDDIPF